MADATKGEDGAHFSDAYHAARTGYGIASGLLLAWGLIGLSVSEGKLGGLPVEASSPAALPYALVVLVLYFAFRLTIEWLQTDLRRRRVRVSQVDFAVSHSIGAGAIATYIVQRLGGAQAIAGWIRGPASLLALGFAMGAGLAGLALVRRSARTVYWSAAGIVAGSLSLLTIAPVWQVGGLAVVTLATLLVPLGVKALSAQRSPAVVTTCRKVYKLSGPRGQRAEVAEEPCSLTKYHGRSQGHVRREGFRRGSIHSQSAGRRLEHRSIGKWNKPSLASCAR